MTTWAGSVGEIAPVYAPLAAPETWVTGPLVHCCGSVENGVVVVYWMSAAAPSERLPAMRIVRPSGDQLTEFPRSHVASETHCGASGFWVASAKQRSPSSCP